MLIFDKAFSHAVRNVLRVKWMRHAKLFQYMLYLLPAYLLLNNFGLSWLEHRNNGEVVNVGALTIGTIVSGLIVAFLSARSVSPRERNFYLGFPINRPVYAVGNFIFIIISSATLLLLTSLAMVFEQILGRIVYWLSPASVIVNSVSLYNLLVGYAVSLGYIVFIASIVFLISNVCVLPIKQSILVALVCGLLLGSSIGRKIIFQCLHFIIAESSVLILLGKLSLITIVLQGCAWLLFRTREAGK